MVKYDKLVSDDEATNVAVIAADETVNNEKNSITDATAMKMEQIMNTVKIAVDEVDSPKSPLSLVVISDVYATNNNTINKEIDDQILHCVVSAADVDQNNLNIENSIATTNLESELTVSKTIPSLMLTSSVTDTIKTTPITTIKSMPPTIPVLTSVKKKPVSADDNALTKNGNDKPEPPQMISENSISTSLGTSLLSNDADEDCRAEATYRFRVEQFSKLKEQLLSPSFYVRNLPWRIMVLPKAAVPPTNEHNHNHQSEHRALGFFLQCNAESDSTTWSCNAIAELRLLSFRSDIEPFTRQIKHLFYNKENDWGFPHFIPWIDVLDPEMEYIRNDTILLEVRLTAEAPHGVFWDSKKHTGYVGLKNQGATCYMNSLLQTLFFTNYLRRAVYRMPTESDDTGKSVGLALQRVFHDLQFSDKPVGTKKLTKSFGWETLDSFMQHDVQEFLRVLLDKIETKMNKTCVEGTVPKLFEGKMSSYIKCKNVECASTRLETFYDIQLNIKGKKNIEESFQNYVTTEILDGDNLYDAGEHGLQEAEKGVIFVKFPPVLHLHLMRFQYDPITDNSVKFNDRFEFYEHIDLDRYLQRLEDVPAKYTLHAVLVHNGDNHGGHYVVYINPLGDGNWCKFDDDVVSRCSKTEAIDHNFGGGAAGDNEMALNVRPAGNAYMLVYIRDTDIASTLINIPESDIPLELVERLLEERRVEQTRRRERTESNQFMTVNVLIEEQFECIDSRDIFDLEKAKYRVFKVKRTQPISEMIQLFESTFLMSAGRMRLWQLIPRANTILRPILFDYKEHWTKSISHCAELQNPWIIFLELMSPDSKLKDFPLFDRDRDILLLFKFYNPYDKRLNYCSMKTYTLKTTKISDLVQYLNERLQLPLDTSLTLYEEQSKNVIHKINDHTVTLDKVLKIMREIMDSDVIIFERNDWNDKTLELPTCIDYFRDLMFRIQVIFCDKNNPGEQGIQMELSQRLTYEQIVMIIGAKIESNPNEIQLYKCENYKDVPGIAIRSSYEGTLKDILSTNKSKCVKKIYYEKLSMNVKEFQLKRHFKCVYVTPNMKDEKELLLYVNKDGTVKDLLDVAAKELRSSSSDNRPPPVLRLVTVQCYKACLGPGEHVLLETLSSLCDVTSTASGGIAGGGLVNQKVYRIEEVPQDEMELGEGEQLVPVVHFYKDIYNAFGVPFFVKAKDGETFIVIKDRIQKRLNLSTKEFERYKFAVVIRGCADFIEDDTLTCHLNDFKRNDSIGLPFSYFGLEHLDRTQRRSRYNYVEKAIKIYN